MALPFDIANFNLISFANIYPSLMDTNPADVTYQYKDSAGVIQNKVVQNRGKLQQQVIGDIVNPLNSAMSRTFYIDPVNGNDANTGLVSTSPKKTFKNIIDSVPRGSTVLIYPVADNLSFILNDVIVLDGKSVVIDLRGGDITQTLNSSTNNPGQFRCYYHTGSIELLKLRDFNTTLTAGSVVTSSVSQHDIVPFSSVYGTLNVLFDAYVVDNIPQGRLNINYATVVNSYTGLGCLNLRMRNMRINTVAGGGYLLSGLGTYLLNFSGVVLPTYTTFKDVCPYLGYFGGPGVMPSNVVSNVDLRN